VAYVDWTEGMWQEHTALRHLEVNDVNLKTKEILIDWKKCLKNYLLDLSNGCMQTYWYFIIILAGVFAMLFVQSWQQRLYNFVLYQSAKNIPPRPLSQTSSISSYLFFSRVEMIKSASRQVLFFTFLMILNWLPL